MLMAAERDGRTMNHMAADLKLTHARLERWGKWAKSAGVRAWPQVTLLGRIIEQGPVGAAIPTSALLTAIPEDIQHVDMAVARLGEVDRRVVRTYYMEWGPIEVMARQRRMSIRQFKAVLNRARWRVDAYLGAITDLSPHLKTSSDTYISPTTAIAS